MQLAAARYRPRVSRIGVFHSQCDVSLQLLEQPLPDLARGDEFSVSAGEWRVVNQIVHRDRRLLHRDAGEPLGMLEVGHSESDLDSLQAGERDDLTGGSLWNFDPVESLKGEQSGDTRLFGLLRRVERQ